MSTTTTTEKRLATETIEPTSEAAEPTSEAAEITHSDAIEETTAFMADLLEEYSDAQLMAFEISGVREIAKEVKGDPREAVKKRAIARGKKFGRKAVNAVIDARLARITQR
jgi:hypothetical protein